MLGKLPFVLFVYLNVGFQTLNDFVKVKRVSRKAHSFLSSPFCDSLVNNLGGWLLTISHWSTIGTMIIPSIQVKRLDMKYTKRIEFVSKTQTIKEIIFHSFCQAWIYLRDYDLTTWKLEKVSILIKKRQNNVYFSRKGFELFFKNIENVKHVKMVNLDILIDYSIFILNCLSSSIFKSVTCIRLKVHGRFFDTPEPYLTTFIQNLFPNVTDIYVDASSIEINQDLKHYHTFNNWYSIVTKPKDTLKTFLWSHTGKLQTEPLSFSFNK